MISETSDYSLSKDIESPSNITNVFKNQNQANQSIPQSPTENSQEHLTVSTKNPISEEEIINNVLLCYELSQEYWQKGEAANAIDALDYAYSQILTLAPQNNSLMEQMKEDLREMISKRIVEIYASKNSNVVGKHKAIPVIINKHVEEQIKILGISQNDGFFKQAYKRSGKYRSLIIEELKKAGLPEELSWLPLIESGFNVNALSNARALGLWQFISSTGYRFGLKRDQFIDERLDPIKSTKAAILYLKELHTLFGDWSTAIAAYNCGEHLVLNVIKKQKVNYLDNFWDLYERLPNETAQFFPRFIATLHIVNHPEQYGLDEIEIDKPLEFDTVEISKQVQLSEIAKAIGISEQLLHELNPELRHKMLPNTTYSLRIPPETKEILIASLDQLPSASLSALSAVDSETKNANKPNVVSQMSHKVQKGETLSQIARKYGVSVKQILQANRLRHQKNLQVGSIIKLPQVGSIIKMPIATETSLSKKIAKNNVKYARTHIVKRGETLWTIAQRYGTTPKEIMKFNKLNNQSLQKGQVLKIPIPFVESQKQNRNYSLNNSLIPTDIS